MKPFQSHKRVNAACITGVCPAEPDGAIVVLTDDGMETAYPPEMFARFQPTIGDYVVEYEDGYRSFSPKKAFEEGYAEVGNRLVNYAKSGHPTDIDAAIAAKTGDKVTKDYIESRIIDGSYQRLGETVTICNIVLDNGYSVRGESACVDPANFEAGIGQKLAYDDAFRKLWPLFGFLLAEKRFHVAQAPAQAEAE